MDETYKRHSRRSHPNLQHYSLTPLTPQYPLPLTIETTLPPRKASLSYLSPRSLPQTPSILSRSPSRTRLRPKTSKSSHALADLTNASNSISTSKFSTYFPSPGYSRNGRQNNLQNSTSNNTDWLLQIASTLTITTAESKGQSWLATRASSTSLDNINVPTYEPQPEDLTYGVDNPLRHRASSTFADDEFSSPSSIRFQSLSRPASRYASFRSSRQGSRVGLMALSGVKTFEEGEQEDRDQGHAADEEEGPRWVDVEEVNEVLEEWMDEGEMRRVVLGRVGGWVDWAIGWMDFRGDEVEGRGEGEGEVEREEEKIEEGIQGYMKESTQEMDMKMRRLQRERERALLRGEDEKVEGVEVQGEGGWRDAAWLLSVAAKVLT